MISYIGGKARIGKWITEYIPTDIETYVEGFSGMFWVFFNMDLENYPNLKTVVYNDYNRLNSNLFKWIKQYDILWDALSNYPCQQLGVTDTPPEYSQMFNQYQREVFNDDLIITEENSLEVACKYIYVLTQVFSGSKPETASYMDYKGKYRCKVLILMDKLKNNYYREHIDRINFVENLDFEKVVEKYDSPTTYFYMDPPYYKTENYYSNHIFTIETHQRLATCLQNVKGKFGLSYYDFPQLSEWFPKETYNWVNKSFKKAAAAKKDGTQNDGIELLIMNYTPTLTKLKKSTKKGSRKKTTLVIE
jgi:DNA adenine methylase